MVALRGKLVSELSHFAVLAAEEKQELNDEKCILATRVADAPSLPAVPRLTQVPAATSIFP
eukprot:4973924-Alexandrium_andersonii.AAC.1